VIFSAFIKLRHSLKSQIITLCCSRCEDDFIWYSFYQWSYLSSTLSTCFSWYPTISMTTGMRVSKLILKIGNHGIRNSEIQWCCCLVIQINLWNFLT